MPSIDTAVQKQAARLNISLDKLLSTANAEKLRAALDDIGVTATLAEIQTARDSIAAHGAQTAANAGDRSSTLRDGGTQQPAGASTGAAASVGVRTGNVAVFDAEASFKAAYGAEMAAAGTLQWRPAETTGLSVGGPKRRWIPTDAELAAMDKRPLTDLLSGASADVSVYWPKNAAERAPGAKIYLEKKGPFGPEFSSLGLRAPKVEAPPTAKPDATTKGHVDDLLRQAGITDANVLARGGTVEVYLTEGFDKVRTALKNAGFTDTRIDDPYTGYQVTAQVDPATSIPVRLVKDEVGGGA